MTQQGRRLKKTMRDVGLKQARVAKRLRISPGNLSNMLAGVIPLDPRTAAAIDKEIRRHCFTMRKKAQRLLEGA